MADELKELTNLVGSLTAKVEKLSTTPAVDPKSVIGTETSHAPAVRKGESALTGRRFSFTRAMGLTTGFLRPEECKVEAEVVKSFRNGLRETGGMHSEFSGNGFMYPVSKSFLKDETNEHDSTKFAYQALKESMQQEPDLDEAAYYARNGGPSIRKSAMSYLQDSIGGALVAPPEMGELIPIMRNKSACNRAGATQTPLPPQGKWVAPRVTGVTTGYQLPENTSGTESNPTFGQVSMEAKKIMCLARIPNELFRYATAMTDAMLRNDMATTLALDYDYQGIYGPGNGRIKGLINYSGTGELYDYAAATPTPKGVATNGNQLRPEDGYNMAGAILDRNFEDSTFRYVMRPILWNSISAFRADAVTAGDQASLFVQALTRAVNAGTGKNWCGYDVITSSQIRNNQTKGSSGATLTEVIGGCWEQMLQGLYGAVEFFVANQGDTMVAADQTLVRATLLGDVAFKQPGAFAYYKLLLTR